MNKKAPSQQKRNYKYTWYSRMKQYPDPTPTRDIIRKRCTAMIDMNEYRDGKKKNFQ